VVKGRAMPLQAWTEVEDRSYTIGTWRW